MKPGNTAIKMTSADRAGKPTKVGSNNELMKNVIEILIITPQRKKKSISRDVGL